MAKTLLNLIIITLICMPITKTPTCSHVDSATVDLYGRITPTKSFYTTTLSAGLHQSHDYSCYVSIRILAYAPFWL